MKIITSFIIILCLVSCENNNEETTKSNTTPPAQSFVKAAHYFGSAWPKTFWEEFEQAEVDSGLEQIKNDGFNTIVLVVPWMGFETGFNSKTTSSNQKLYNRLDFVLKKIKSKNLNYILRLGFPHSFAPNIETNAIELCTDFYSDPLLQNKWSDYLHKVKKVTDMYSTNLTGVLVSWEDFWCPHFVFPHLEENRRQELAQTIGFSQWLMQKDLTLLKVLLGTNDVNVANITLPKKDDLTYFYYIKFIDLKFDELVLKSTKKIFPQTAMEIRVDKDPVKGANNETIWVAHDLYFEEQNHRGTYWAPFWGAENIGEKLTLKQTLFNFEYFLNYVTDEGKYSNHIIEQFNFTDNTPYFPNNASLHEADVGEFLEQSTPLLKKYSKGYGLWAYRDYADNALYNASFELGLDGWQTQGSVEIVGNTGDQQLKMQKNAFITQNYQPHQRYMLASSYDILKLCIKSSEKGDIEIYANNSLAVLAILNEGDNCIEFEAENFVNSKQVEFKLIAKTSLTIDEIKLYGFVQKLGVYNEFNQNGPYLDAIKKLNSQL